MTQLSTYGGVVVPSPAEAAVVPADLLRIVNQLTGTAQGAAKVNAVVTSQAERDSNYDGYPAGGLIVCPNNKTIWMSLGKISGVQTWDVVYIDTGWITDGFVLNTNWNLYAANSIRARRVNKTMNVRVQATWTGPNIQADSNSGSQPGNIVDQTILTSLPSDFTPTDEQISNFRSTYTGGTAIIQPAGTVKLLDMHTNSVIATNQSIQTQFWWFADN